MDFDKDFDVEKFDRYYSGEMTGDERLEMEKELSSDPLMRENYKTFIETMDALAHESLKKKIAANPEFRAAIQKGLQKPNDHSKFNKLALLGLLILLVAGLSIFAYFLFFQPDLQSPNEQKIQQQEIAALSMDRDQRNAMVRYFIENAVLPDSRLRGMESETSQGEISLELAECRDLLLETHYERAMDCIDDLATQNDESRWLFALALFGNDELEEALERMEGIKSDRTSRFFSYADFFLDSIDTN